jgi:hypothetical protein
MWVTLFFLKSMVTPRFSWSATFRLRSCAGPRSTESSDMEIPCFVASFTSFTRRADVRRALVGMHPMLRQTPPSFAVSTQATSIPS